MRVQEQQVSVEKALRAYRAQLSAGAYFFVGKVRNGQLQGIEEIVVRQDRTDHPGDGKSVIFGFFDRGRDPIPGSNGSPEHPLVHHVQATSPEFMKKLHEHIIQHMNRD